MGDFFKGYEEFPTVPVKQFVLIEYPDSGDGAKALTESNGKLIMYGDDYHDKIDEMITGFLAGISYCGFRFQIEETEKEDTYMYNDFDDEGMMKSGKEED